MSYSISSLKIQRHLFGATFRIASPAGEFIFRIPDKNQARMRRGSEGYGLLVTCVHPTRGELPAFLKIFAHDVAERHVRTHCLISYGLAKHFDWLFMAAPFCAVRRLVVNDVEIVGHVALEVRAAGGGSAEDIGRLRSAGNWPWSVADRRRFAAELACAVEALEGFALAHADISPQNVMIGADDRGRPAATLCDFDAFYHPLQPPLPEIIDGNQARPLGTSGYQSPAMVRNISARKSGLQVQSDRFALAAMACDLVCLEPSDRREPGQPLLDDDAIARASTLSIPRAVRARWPEGIDLLDRALRARDDGAMPAPVDWMSALGVQVARHVPPVTIPFTGDPALRVFEIKDGQRRLRHQFRLQTASGPLTGGADLAEVRFERPGQGLLLSLPWPDKVVLDRARKRHDLGLGPCRISLQPGDTLCSTDWCFEVSEHGVG